VLDLRWVSVGSVLGSCVREGLVWFLNTALGDWVGRFRGSVGYWHLGVASLRP